MGPGAVLAAGGTRDTGKRLVMPNINKSGQVSCNQLVQPQMSPFGR